MRSNPTLDLFLAWKSFRWTNPNDCSVPEHHFTPLILIYLHLSLDKGQHNNKLPIDTEPHDQRHPESRGVGVACSAQKTGHSTFANFRSPQVHPSLWLLPREPAQHPEPGAYTGVTMSRVDIQVFIFTDVSVYLCLCVRAVGPTFTVSTYSLNRSPPGNGLWPWISKPGFQLHHHPRTG